MSKHLYKQISPHLQRISVDGGDPPININELLLLENSNILYKDYLKLAFCPELYGYKKDTRSGINYVTKGYSANSIQQELGPNLILNGDFNNSSNWTYNTGWTYNSANKSAYLNNSSSSTDLIQANSNILKKGVYYKITFDYVFISGLIDRVYINVYDSLWLGYNTSGKKSFIIQSQYDINVNIIIRIIGECYIDNISIQEILSNDLTQTSSANQPYLDKIAPAEKLSAKNPNGGSSYLTHPTISFGASDEWTLEFNYNCFGKLGNNAILGDTENTTKICLYNYGYLQIYGNGINWNTTYTTSRHIGKNTNVCITYKSGTTKVYIGGVLIDSISNINYPISLDRLFYGVYYWDFGSLYSYHIFSKALSASEIAERSAILRSIFSEIPFTRIGDQIWSVRNFEATVTPQGNVIPEVQSNTTWSTSQTLYDNAYAATSGTVEQKTYAAVKAAAMWCHYNNDPALGAIYGKLYNWFAVKLLQMDIDYYNAANPTTPWGWRVPTQSDFSTLLTTLGGASVAGNSLKTTNYYASSIGTNTSGFSAIGNGARQADGSFNALVYWSRIYALDTSLRLDQGNTNCSFYRDNNIEGYGIRLIKV